MTNYTNFTSVTVQSKAHFYYFETPRKRPNERQ